MLKNLVLAFILATMMSLVLIDHVVGQTADVAVVINPQNAVSNVSSTELRKIFAGQKHSWNGNTPVKIIVRAPGSPERAVLLRLLGMSEANYKQYWTAQIVRGEVDAEPMMLPSIGIVKEAVKIYPGAICLVAAEDAKSVTGLKVLRVDGRAPGESGYPLH